MTALQLLQGATNVLFVSIFVLVAANAYRRRTRTDLDALLLFGSLALILLIGPALQLLGLQMGQPLTVAVVTVLMALPYFMLRLLEDFADVPLLVRAATFGGLIASVVIFTISGPALDPAVALFIIGYFGAVSLYTAFGFVRLSRRSSGVTQRRTQAVASGMGLLGLAILVAGITTVVPGAAGFVSGATQVLALLAAVSWFLGFVPPAQLRRYWQEPELRAFLQRAGTLPRLPTTEAILRELERGAAESLGARATIGLY